jgi:putative membrane protein
MSVMMVAFWAIVVVAVILLARALWNRQEPSWPARPPARSPQDILAERYARGEIDSDEYQQRLRDIASHAEH